MREIVKRETIEASVGAWVECGALVCIIPLCRVNTGYLGWRRTRGRWGKLKDSLFIDLGGRNRGDLKGGGLESGGSRGQKLVDCMQTAICVSYPFYRPSCSILTKRLLTTRLETRTKESNNDASIRVVNSECGMKVKSVSLLRQAQQEGVVSLIRTTHLEYYCWDPKGGELCLTRAKPEETLVEARSRSDVQIDGQSWV